MIVPDEEAPSAEPPIALAPPLDDPSLYYSRELSWLEFNDRVLEEAFDESNPLLERLKFVAINGTNLDEYFMIRVAALKQQIAAEVHKRSNDGRLPAEQLHAISERLRPSLERFAKLLHGDLLPALEREGIVIRRYDDLDATARASLEKLFQERVFPVLTPLAVDQGHPFPYISNLSLSLGVELFESTPDGPVAHFARVKVPPSLSRFIAIDAPEGAHHFVMLEDVIAHNLGVLFSGLEIGASYCFRVTRDADLDLQEDEADDLLVAIESELRRRRFGEPVRLEVDSAMPEHLRAMLLEALSLQPVDLYAVDAMLGTSDLWALVGIDRPDLHDAPFTPAIPKRLVGEADIFAAIREGDILLHHPYDSFDPVVQFLKAAANDPQVRSSTRSSKRPRKANKSRRSSSSKRVSMKRTTSTGHAIWNASAHTWCTASRDSKSTRKLSSSCATSPTASAATCTSAPATTTTRRRRSTPISRSLRATPNSARTSRTCSTD
jgi:polyphosphate kinase